MQAWVPTVTEKGLQMQSLPQDASSAILSCSLGQTRCWFLSCLVVYWTCFPTFARHLTCIERHVCKIHHGQHICAQPRRVSQIQLQEAQNAGHLGTIGTASFYCTGRFCLEWLRCAAFLCFTC